MHVVMRKQVVDVFFAVKYLFYWIYFLNYSLNVLGDSRSNENTGLTSLHTIFIRLHNSIATSLLEVNPTWSDDLLYHETRRIITAVLQNIIYKEFLPTLIGPSRSNFGIYQYDPSVKRNFQ